MRCICWTILNKTQFHCCTFTNLTSLFSFCCCCAFACVFFSFVCRKMLVERRNEWKWSMCTILLLMLGERVWWIHNPATYLTWQHWNNEWMEHSGVIGRCLMKIKLQYTIITIIMGKNTKFILMLLRWRWGGMLATDADNLSSSFDRVWCPHFTTIPVVRSSFISPSFRLCAFSFRT